MVIAFIVYIISFIRSKRRLAVSRFAASADLLKSLAPHRAVDAEFGELRFKHGITVISDFAVAFAEREKDKQEIEIMTHNATLPSGSAILPSAAHGAPAVASTDNMSRRSTVGVFARHSTPINDVKARRECLIECSNVCTRSVRHISA